VKIRREIKERELQAPAAQEGTETDVRSLSPAREALAVKLVQFLFRHCRGRPGNPCLWEERRKAVDGCGECDRDTISATLLRRGEAAHFRVAPSQWRLSFDTEANPPTSGSRGIEPVLASGHRFAKMGAGVA
jgi:hypothetical protein